MRKHLLRILTVLLVVCLGAFLFVACGDTNDDNGDQGNGTQQGGEEQPQKYTLSFTGDTANVDIVVDNQAANYAAGTTVKFSVTAKSGYTLVSVKNGSNDVPKGSDNKYSVTLNANTTITVTTSAQGGGGEEQPKTYTLSFTGDTANVDIDIDNEADSYAAGTTVTFTVTAKTGYTLVSVKNGGNELTEQNGKYSVTLNENTTITITTQTQQGGGGETQRYTLGFTGDTNNVDIDIDNEANDYAAGTTVTFTVTAKSGYTLVSVKNGGNELTEQNGKYSVTLNANTTITITTSAQGSGEEQPKTITPTKTEFYGNYFVTLTVELADGQWIEANVSYVKVNGTRTPHNDNKGWEVRGDTHTMYNVQLEAGQGDVADPKAEYVIDWYDANDKLIAKTTVNPDVGPKTYTVKLNVSGNTADDGNSATLSKTEPVESGTKVTLTVVTAEGFNVKVTVNGQDVTLTQEGTYEIEVTGETVVNVTFYQGEEPPADDTPVYDIKEVKAHDNPAFAKIVMADNKAYEVIDTAATAKASDGTHTVNLAKTTGFIVEVNVQININLGTEFDRTNFTIEWYDADGNKIAISHYLATEVPGGDVTDGIPTVENEAGSLTHDKAWTLYNNGVTVTEAKDEDGTVTLTYSDKVAANWWWLQLYYNDSSIKEGDYYTYSFKITSKNGGTYRFFGDQDTERTETLVLTAGQEQQFTSKVVGFVTGKATISIYMGADGNTNIEADTLTISELVITKQSAPAQEEKGELVEGTLSQDLVNGSEGEQKDKFILWWAKEAWDGCGTIVTLTPAVEEVYKDGKIAFTYKGGSVNFSVQLFYSNTNLQNNTKYYLTLKIKLTAAADVNIIVNGKPVALKAGQVNDVEVLFVNTTETAGDAGISSLDIQFPGTNAGTEDTDPSVGIDITDVAWYNVKTGGSDVEPDTVVTFDTNDGSEVDSKSYADGAKFSTDKPADPTKADHTFLYWYYLEGEQETKVDDDFIPSAHATDHALTLYAKWAEHTYPDGADSHGNYVCTTCGAILHPGDAVGTVAEVPAQMTGLDTKGLSASFWLHAANNDWDAIGLWTNFGKFKIALPNIQANNQGTDVSSDETIAALRTKIGNGTCFPSSVGAQMLNGAEWNAICAATEVYVTITVGPNAINFYKNGVQVFSYPATMTFVGTTAEGTMGDFIKAFLLSAQKEGVTVAVPEHAYGGFISAENVLVEYGKVYTTEQAKALYDNYLVEKELYPKAHSVHTYVNGKCSVCGYTCPHTFTAEEGECSVCHQFVGKQLHTETYGELKNGFADNSKMYTMNKPESGKTLEVVFTATIATHVQVSDQDVMKYMAYQGIVTRIYDATTEEAFLQGNRFELEDKPWLSKTEANRNLNLADYGNNNRVGFFYRVTVLWTDANITVTYEAWTPKDDLNQGADLSSTITFTGVEKDTYNLFFGLDGMTSTDGKLVVNEYSAKA